MLLHAVECQRLVSALHVGRCVLAVSNRPKISEALTWHQGEMRAIASRKLRVYKSIYVSVMNLNAFNSLSNNYVRSCLEQVRQEMQVSKQVSKVKRPHYGTDIFRYSRS